MPTLKELLNIMKIRYESEYPNDVLNLPVKPLKPCSVFQNLTQVVGCEADKRIVYSNKNYLHSAMVNRTPIQSA